MECIGPRDCDVAMFAKSGRLPRYEAIRARHEAPQEFFYGLFHLDAAGFKSSLYSTSGKVPGAAGAIADAVERFVASYTGLGVRPLSFELQRRAFPAARVLISFVDGFSLTLGLSRVPRSMARIGGFQALSDIEERLPRARRNLARSMISRAARNLDLAFFLSPADRGNAIERYGFDPARSSVFPFGVDTDFWTPSTVVQPERAEVFAIGQDLNRDFESLIAAPFTVRTRIVTRLQLDVPPDKGHITLVRGGFDGGELTDVQLREAYRSALCVVVPIKDVMQPSGQSVTLQAMSCGTPVILTRTRGLWDPEGMIDGGNCLLVPPSNPGAIAAAIQMLQKDPDLRNAIARSARQTVLERYSLERMGDACVALADAGLKIANSRTSTAGRSA